MLTYEQLQMCAENIKNKINQKLKMNLVYNVTFKNNKFSASKKLKYLLFTFENDLERFFFENYLINNVYGKNYKSIFRKQNIIITKNNFIYNFSYKSTIKENEIRIYNYSAFIILLNHFKLKFDYEGCRFDILMSNYSFLSITTNTGKHIPVLILTNSDNSLQKKLIREILLSEYHYDRNIENYNNDNDKNVYNNVSGFVDNLINLQVTNSNHSFDNERYLEYFLKYSDRNIYIVYHPFNRDDTSIVGNTYKKKFTRVGDNTLGEQLMKDLRSKSVPQISEKEKLFLKKSIDKMFHVGKVSEYEDLFTCSDERPVNLNVLSENGTNDNDSEPSSINSGPLLGIGRGRGIKTNGVNTEPVPGIGRGRGQGQKKINTGPARGTNITNKPQINSQLNSGK